MSVEHASFKLLMSEGQFELRLYEPMGVVMCRESDDEGEYCFGRLFNYISGNNEESQKISMTSPVINSIGDEYTTTEFVMPVKFSIDDLPKPNDQTLKVKQVPKRQLAVITFSGKVDSKVINEKKRLLNEWIKDKKWIITGKMELARYDPPYIPYFMRHNELMIEVKNDE